MVNCLADYRTDNERLCRQPVRFSSFFFFFQIWFGQYVLFFLLLLVVGAIEYKIPNRLQSQIVCVRSSAMNAIFYITYVNNWPMTMNNGYILIRKSTIVRFHKRIRYSTVRTHYTRKCVNLVPQPIYCAIDNINFEWNVRSLLVQFSVSHVVILTEVTLSATNWIFVTTKYSKCSNFDRLIQVRSASKSTEILKYSQWSVVVMFILKRILKK